MNQTQIEQQLQSQQTQKITPPSIQNNNQGILNKVQFKQISSQVSTINTVNPSTQVVSPRNENTNRRITDQYGLNQQASGNGTGNFNYQNHGNQNFQVNGTLNSQHSSGNKQKSIQSQVKQQRRPYESVYAEEKQKPQQLFSKNIQLPQKSVNSYEAGVHLDQKDIQENLMSSRHKTSQSQSMPLNNNLDSHRSSGKGEQQINKRHLMRMTSGDSKKDTPHNITKSLIEEGSEDFTNIEEHINQDARISCRNAVAIIKQVQQQNLRNRRGTTQSNISRPSDVQSKEDTFESSSFFDEGISNRQVLQHHLQLSSPHKCNQVEGYNLPTIFNTLMFGIDQSKVSDNVKDSFTHMKNKVRTSSQYSAQQQHKDLQLNTDYFQQKKLSAKIVQSRIEQNRQDIKNQNRQINVQERSQNQNKLSSLVTKVEMQPIKVFDQGKATSSNGMQLILRNDSQKSLQSVEKYQPKNKSPKNNNGKHSQLSIIAQQNFQIEQHIDVPDSMATEMLHKINDENDDQNYQMKEQENEEETDEQVAENAANQIEDFQSSELHRNHLIQTLQSLQYIKTLPPVDPNEIKSRAIKLPNFKNSDSNYISSNLFLVSKTIIFDLDETLVHCIDDIENVPCDEVINVTFPNGETVQAGINIRPYAIECLKKANENYQVVVFTASHKAYADVVLDSLDPEGTLIQYRLYRDHCIRTEEGIYIKDLRIITNRQLKDLIIVDNAVYSFGYQLDNGIPIIPFYDDKSDEELMHLIFYFNCLAQCQDVREQNRKAFQLKDLQEIDIAEYLQSMMNQDNNSLQQEDEEDANDEEDEEPYQ